MESSVADERLLQSLTFLSLKPGEMFCLSWKLAGLTVLVTQEKGGR